MHLEAIGIGTTLLGRQRLVRGEKDGAHLSHHLVREGLEVFLDRPATGYDVSMIAFGILAECQTYLVIVQRQLTIHPKQVGAVEGHRDRLVLIEHVGTTPATHAVFGVKTQVENHLRDEVAGKNDLFLDINALGTTQAGAQVVANAQRQGAEHGKAGTDGITLILGLLNQAHLASHSHRGRLVPPIDKAYQQADDDRGDEPFPVKGKGHQNILEIEQGGPFLGVHLSHIKRFLIDFHIVFVFLFV